MRRKFLATIAAIGLAAMSQALPAAPAPTTLLNVSYDPTRELYEQIMSHSPKKGRKAEADRHYPTKSRRLR